MARLHAIALDLIFQAIFPQAGFLNPSLSFGPEAPWARALRTKKALTLVCKFWQGHALPYLYSDIVIRHVGQLPALVRTIRSASGLYGCLVKSLKILCEITYYPYKAFARNSLIYIFQHCPNLRALSISYAPMIWKLLVPDLFLSVSIGLYDDDPNPNLTVDRFPGIPFQISSLECSQLPLTNISFYWLRASRFNQAFPNLRSLTLCNKSTILVDRKAKEMLFPLLESLCLLNGFPDLPNWKAPKLTHLKLVHSLATTGSFAGNKFLDIHAPNITHIYIVDESRKPVATASLINRCINLKHMVLYFQTTASKWQPYILGSSIFQRELPYVDILVELRRDQRLLDLLRNPSQRPWKNVRLLDASLITNIPDLPYLLPPEAKVDDEPCIHHIFDNSGACIVQTNSYIFWRSHPSDDSWERELGLIPFSDNEESPVASSVDDEDSDSDYCPSSDEESSVASSIDDVPISNEPQVEDRVGVIDEEEILNIYRLTLSDD